VRLIRLTSWVLLGLVANLLLAQAALGQVEAYYNIASVTSEQLNNAVRIKRAADGAIAPEISRWGGGQEHDYYIDWATGGQRRADRAIPGESRETPDDSGGGSALRARR
jgi:hypothetical protein